MTEQKLDRVIAFKQIETGSYHDGLRECLLIFALDATGALWQREWGATTWRRVEQPADSSAVAWQHTTLGVKTA